MKNERSVFQPARSAFQRVTLVARLVARLGIRDSTDDSAYESTYEAAA